MANDTEHTVTCYELHYFHEGELRKTEVACGSGMTIPYAIHLFADVSAKNDANNYVIRAADLGPRVAYYTRSVVSVIALDKNNKRILQYT